jgi:hypothetical protein
MHGFPSPWLVASGEEVKMGFAAIAHRYLPNEVEAIEMDDFIIIGLLNWEQILLTDKTYFSENITNWDEEDAQPIEGYFTITAPTASGYYDVVFFAIGNPDDSNTLLHGFFAIRFTLKVE